MDRISLLPALKSSSKCFSTTLLPATAGKIGCKKMKIYQRCCPLERTFGFLHVPNQGTSWGRLITTTKLFQLTPICALQASRAEGPRQNQNKRTDREIMRANDMHVKVLFNFSDLPPPHRLFIHPGLRLQTRRLHSVQRNLIQNPNRKRRV
jgi:hypothetical protein